MSKEAYFEMCEALGTEPLDSEIPVEFEDFPLEVQEAIGVYNKLQDNWDYMNGNYIGKNYVGLSDIFEILEIAKEDRKYLYELLSLIDNARSKAIKANKPVQNPAK